MPIFYHLDGTFAAVMERSFDPDIWRDVTGGEVAERVRRLTRVTPLVPAPALGRRTGADVWLKLESLQRTGSFKLRGAPRASRRCARADPKPRVVAASAGNHGLGVALAARHFGVDATVLVSAQTPEVKRAGIAALGAASRSAARPTTRPRRWRASAPGRSGLVFVSAFDDDHVIAGNGGLLAREILAQLPDVQAIVVPVGGGGLAGGIGVEVVPRGIKVLGASPEANCAMRRSLDEGRGLHHLRGRPDAGGGPGGRGQRAHLRDGARLLPRHRAGERAARSARRSSMPTARSASPARRRRAGAGRAARRREQDPRRRTVVVISGGNIEPDLLDQLLSGVAVRRLG
jgi:threonine dehydratase